MVRQSGIGRQHVGGSKVLSRPIPIENIYYLLCYAWNRLEEKDRVDVDAEDCTELIDLLAGVLINGTKILLKRGIDRSYINHVDEIAGVKGKLQFSETLKRNLLPKQRTVCEFDEFSADVLTNQIVVSTFKKLLRIENVDRRNRDAIRNVLRFLDGISEIEITAAHFSQVRINRNNRFYGFLLSVCRLIHDNTMLSERTGKWQFKDFSRDEKKMNKIFEDFLFNFYRIEQDVYRVSRPQINWQFSGDDEDMRLLPKMQTDIVLESSEKKIVMDAKYYNTTLGERYDTRKIHSHNLYQIFSYLMNQRDGSEKSESCRGILVYPTTDAEQDLAFSYKGMTVEVRTVNLNDNFRSIHQRLLSLIR